MSEKPEALRLADELDAYHTRSCHKEAAAELRRLAKVEAQREALLEACRAMLTHMGMDEDEWNKPTFDQARAAIAKAEGEKE